MIKKLNDEQKNAQEKMINFVKSKENFFLLSGGAGTGKTYTIGSLISYLQKHNKRLWIACSAPTNKAVKVIRNSTKRWNTHIYRLRDNLSISWLKNGIQ